MEHKQIQLTCSVCNRKSVIDIMSTGVTHQFIQAVTCLECAQIIGGRILEEGEVEDLGIDTD